MSKLLLWKSQKEVACRSSTGLFIGAQSAVAVREREGERKRDRVSTHPGFLGSLYQTLRHSAPPKRHFSTPPAVSLLGGPALFYAHSARTNRESSEFINKKKRETGERHGHDNLYAIHRWISAVRGAGEVSICRCFSVKIDVFIILVVHVCGTAVC